MKTSINATPLSNLEYLKTTCDQSVDMITQIATMFLDGTPKSIEKMKYLINESKWDDLRREAHKLKSSFLMMGADLTSSKLQEIESTSANEQSDHLIELVHQIEEESILIYDEINNDLMTL